MSEALGRVRRAGPCPGRARDAAPGPRARGMRALAARVPRALPLIAGGGAAPGRVCPLLLCVSIALAGMGCSCGDEPSRAPAVAAPPEHEEDRAGAAPLRAGPIEAVGAGALPTASSARSAAASPTVVVEATVRGYRVTNRVLVETWPPPERARVHAAAPPDMPDFPVVEIDVPVLDDAPLLVPGLRDALSRALEAERARAGTDVTPQRFAVRAPATLSWERVARAIFTAAMVGLIEPELVVRTEGGERVVSLSAVRPGASSPRAAASDLREALGAAVRELPPSAPSAPSGPTSAGEAGAPGRARDGEGPSAGRGATASGDPVAGASAGGADAPSGGASGAALSLALEEHGLRVRRGLVELGPGCRAPSEGGSPAIPLAALGDGATLEACLAAVGEGAARFSSAGGVTHATTTLVLEHLAARGPVEIVLDAR